MKKRIFSLILVLCMVMCLFAGCGSKDKKKGSSDKDDKGPDTNTAQGTVEKMASIKDGTFEMGMKAEGGGMDLEYTITGKVAGQNCALGLKVKGKVQGQDINLDLGELLVVVDKTAYIDLNAIKKAVADNAAIADEEGKQIADLLKDTQLGWFKLPLPDDMKANNTVSEETRKSTEKLLKDILSKGKEDGTTVTFDEAEQLKGALEVVAVFFETDMSKILKEATKVNTSSIDMNKYVQKILDVYYDEMVEAADSLGMDKAQLDAYVDQIKSQNLNELMKDAMDGAGAAELPDDTDLASMASEIRKVADAIKEMPGSIKLATSANGDTYRVSANIDLEEDGKTVKGDIWYQVTEGGANISVPSNVMKLKEIVDQLFNLFMAVAPGQ